jgi:S-DNA-T family DNA segregation ATPase FtsK/SpoIIIE
MKFEKRPATKTPQKRKPKGRPAPSRAPARQGPLIELSTDQWIDLIGYVLIALAALTILSALSPQQGDITSGWLSILKDAFGLGVIVAPVIMFLVGVYLVLRRFGDRFPRLQPGRIVGVTLAYVVALTTLQLVTVGFHAPTVAAAATAAPGAPGVGGGAVGRALVDVLVGAVGNAGAVIVLIVLWIIALMLIVNVTVAQIVDALQQRAAERQRGRISGPSDDVIVPPWDREQGDDLVIHGLKPKRNTPRTPISPDDEQSDELPAAGRPLVINQPGGRKNGAALNAAGQQAPALRPPNTTANAKRLPPPRIIGGADPNAPATSTGAPHRGAAAMPSASVPDISSRFETQRVWGLPSVEKLLEPGNDAALKEVDIRRRAQVIEETLSAFGVPGRVVEVNRGPTITQFGVEPGFIEMKGGKQVKVKVSRIAGLADDLALALSAPRIRIEAPVPGRAIVGIEVPNGETSLVSLRDVMETEEFERLTRKTPLRLGLGQDVSGHPVVADMTAMPHLLIAGTTGSGKSVCVNAIIAALLCFNSPEELRFLMVDPKRVELTGYNGIPHLISPVVVDLEKVTAVLGWVTREMENRYRTFAKHGARNIVDFNTKVSEFAGPVRPDDLKKLPYIVVVIDELADLMMLAPDETEKTICRLAQMARATGIHLIIATQRPSVDVVTGLIKANFPARIAFTVATSVDSRVILDTPGAEKLLGRGDMLVVTPEAGLPTRAQGCFVSDKEINRIVRHWRGQVGGENAGRDPIIASMTAPSIPMTGTLDSDVRPAPMLDSTLTPAPGPLSWDEARALNEAVSATDSGMNKDDKLFQDAVATVRLQGKASISLLQRRLRIGYTRAARLIEQMEERGIVGPNVPGEQFREVLKMNDAPDA